MSDGSAMSEGIELDDDDERLVAYLDGELPAEERATLETRLMNDDSLRQRLRSYQRGWDMLGLLPSPESTEQSIHTTLELVVADLTGHAPARPSLAPSSDAKPRPSSWLANGWIHAIVAMGIAASVAILVNTWRANRERAAEFSDLKVALDMDAYSVGDDLDLIRFLKTHPAWQSVVSASVAPDLDDLVALNGDAVLFPISSLAVLPEEQRAVASARWERFRKVDEPAKEKLRSTARRVREEPDAEEMLRTMRAYARWRESVPENLLEQLESDSDEARRAAMDEAIRESATAFGRISGQNLSDEATERIDYTLRQIARSRLERGDRDVLARRERFQEFAERLSNGQRSEKIALRLVAMSIVGGTTRRRGGDNSNARGSAANGGRLSSLSNSELEMIQSVLPASDAALLESFVGENEWLGSLILRDWCEEALRRHLPGDSPRQSLSERYQALPAAEREILDLLPPAEAQQRLMRRDRS